MVGACCKPKYGLMLSMDDGLLGNIFLRHPVFIIFGKKKTN